MNYFHILTLVLVLAKLFGHFPYSWWLVFTPSIISFGIGLLILMLAVVVAALQGARKERHL